MKIFGLEHILFLVIFALFSIISIILFKKFLPKNKIKIVVKITAGVLLVFVLASRIILTIKAGRMVKFFPDTYCSMMGFILSFVVLFFSGKSKTFQYAITAGFIGGILTIIYPDFIENYESIFQPVPFTGLVYHALMVYLFFLVLCCGYYFPTFKNWSSLPIGLAFMVVVGEFGNSVLGQSNNMYLNAPILKGTIFTWWVLGLSIIINYTIILQIFEMFVLPRKEWTIVRGYNKVKSVFKKEKINLNKRDNKIIDKKEENNNHFIEIQNDKNQNEDVKK